MDHTNIMKRKVIQLARKTHVICLPSVWVHQYNIKKGQELDIEEKGRSLLISAHGDLGESVKHLDISGFSRALIRRCLGTLYKVGFDRFEVHFSNPREYADAQEVIYEEFLGFEIVNQEKNTFSVRQLTHIEAEGLEVVLRRIFRIIQGMANDSIEAIKKKDKDWLTSIALRDLSINKLADFCRRILNKQGLMEQQKAAPLYFIVETLEKIGDAYRDYARQAAETIPQEKTLLDFHQKINIFFNSFYDLFYTFSLINVDKFLTTKTELEKQFHTLFKKSRTAQIYYLYLYSILYMVYDLNGPLMAYHL